MRGYKNFPLQDLRGLELLKSEFKLLSEMIPLVKDGKLKQAIELIKEHYKGSL